MGTASLTLKIVLAYYYYWHVKDIMLVQYLKDNGISIVYMLVQYLKDNGIPIVYILACMVITVDWHVSMNIILAYHVIV